MTRRLAGLALCLVSVSSLLPAADYAVEGAPSTNVSAIASKYRLTVTRQWMSAGELLFVASRSTPLSSSELSALQGEPGVREVERNLEVRAPESSGGKFLVNVAGLAAALFVTGTGDFYGAPARLAYSRQSATTQIHSAAALSKFGAGDGVTVAIIDTGVDPNHPLLRGSLLPGYDFTRDLPGTASEMSDLSQSTVAILDQSTVAILDRLTVPVLLNQSTVAILDAGTALKLPASALPPAFGHGTMVAGLVHLVAPKARILPLKAFRADGSSSVADIVRAVRYAVDQGANVISMSFSMHTPSAELKSALVYAAQRGVMCVASAGNDGRELKVYPAYWKQAIGVGSVSATDRRSFFSNYGDSAATSAPGEALVTTYPGGHYAGVWGTSFSTALLSGSLAVIRQNCPSVRTDGLQDVLAAGARIDQDMGDARLDVLASLSFCSTRH